LQDKKRVFIYNGIKGSDSGMSKGIYIHNGKKVVMKWVKNGNELEQSSRSWWN